VRKISTPPRFDPRALQPVASSYTDYGVLLTVGIKNYENSESPVSVVDINLLTVRLLNFMLLGEQTHTRTRTLKTYFSLEMSLKRNSQVCSSMIPCRLEIPEKNLIFVNTALRTSNFTFNFPLLELRSFENIHACKSGKCKKYSKEIQNKMGYIRLSIIDVPMHNISNLKVRSQNS